MSFGMLGASTLASWGTLGPSWDGPGTLEGTRKDLVRSRLGFYRFFVDLGDPFKKIFGYIWTGKHDFFICISRLFFLMIFGSESGCLGLENQGFCMGGIAKIKFRRSWNSHDLKGYALCRRPPLSGRGLRGGGYVALAHLPC